MSGKFADDLKALRQRATDRREQLTAERDRRREELREEHVRRVEEHKEERDKLRPVNRAIGKISRECCMRITGKSGAPDR